MLDIEIIPAAEIERVIRASAPPSKREALRRRLPRVMWLRSTEPVRNFVKECKVEFRVDDSAFQSGLRKAMSDLEDAVRLATAVFREGGFGNG